MTPTEAVLRRRQHYRLVVGVRAALLAMGLILTLVSSSFGELLPTFVALIAVAAAASIPLQGEMARRMQPVVEAIAAAIVISAAAPQQEYFLPYLIAPALAAGLAGGVIPAVTAVGLAAAVFLIRSSFGLADPVDYHTATGQAVLIALAVGLLAAWVRRILFQDRVADPSYEEAYRLLSQLRGVSRQLAGGLDAVSLAQALLESLAARAPFAIGAVYSRTEGGRLVLLSVLGTERVEWEAPTEATERPVRFSHRFGGGAGESVLLPMRVGGRTTGVVALETATGFSDEGIASAAAAAREAALRLETALLFGEIRSIATVEERRRLAREIHDGIAQELASLGYLMDDLTARARQASAGGLEEELGELRRELTRIISELRLSIFDLRSEVHAEVGLGSALSDYLRAVGTGSPFTVHLSLKEGSSRLGVETETELMRIAQEAITNARRHSGAENLWVTCQVDPPRGLLRVEDDGTGVKSRRRDSFGMEIMRERAARIGAQLTVGDRPRGGTVVEVILGSGRNSASVSREINTRERETRVHDSAVG